MPGDVETIMADASITDPTDIFDLDDTGLVGGGQQLQKYASRSYSYYATNANPTSINTKWTTGENLESAYIESALTTINVDETVDGGWVKTETVRGREMLTGKFCGNGITREYYYLQVDQGTDSPDKVSFIVVEDKIDASNNPISRTVFGLNTAGHKLREVLIDDPTATSPKYWCRSEVLGTSGMELNRVLESRLPSAHNVATAENLRRFLNPTGSGNDSATLRNLNGVIQLFSYNSNGLQTGEKVKEGENGTAYFLSAIDYGDGSNDKPVWLPTATYAFRSKATAKTSGDKTSFTYGFHDAEDKQLMTRTITLPVIAPAENGSSQATVVTQYLDNRGRLRWIKDGDGYVHYLSYNPDTGGLAYVVNDVATGAALPSSISDGVSGQWLEWGSTSPPNGFTRENGLPNALHVAKEVAHDEQGRITKLTDAEGVTAFLAYAGNDVRVYPGFVDDADPVTAGNQPGPLKPIAVLKRNDYGDVVERIEVNPDGVTVSNPPDASESLPQSAYTSWTKVAYNEQSFPQTITRYHSIPTSASGSLGNNYYQVWFDYDELGQRTHIVEIMSGTGSSNAVEQVTKLIYDNTHDHRLIQTQRYVSDTSDDLGVAFNSYNNTAFKTLQELEYDNGGIGDGHVTGVKRKFGTGTNNYTGEALHRTFRGHLRGIEPFFYDTSSGAEANIGPYVVFDPNWEGVDIARALYDTEPTWTGAGGVLDGDGYDPYADDTPSGRRTLAKRSLDALGRTYQTETYTINGGDGSKGKKFVNNRYYDRRNNVVAIAPQHAAAAEFAYDGLNRLYQGRTVLDLAATKYAVGAYQYRNPIPKPDINESTQALLMSGGDDKVVTVGHRVLAGNGNVERFISLQALHGDTDGIDLTANDDYVQTAAYRWYDGAGRVATVADYGSGDTASGQGQFKYFALPARPASAPAGSTDARLVTSFSYDGAGYLAQITDPKGLNRALEYDDLGRRIKQSEHDNLGAAIRWTLAQYNGLDELTALIADTDRNDTFSNGAWTAIGNSQLTRYGYADPTNGRLLTEIKYPDSQSGSDVVSMTYALDGLLTSRTDQRRVSPNATMIAFTYNGRRDLEFQKVTDLIASVDGHVRSIKSEYDELARLTTVTSYSDTEGSGTIRNQVALSYDDLWQLTKSRQSHEGAVTTGTPEVNYGYDTDADVNSVYEDGARLASIIYPNGRVMHLQYGSADSIWDRLSRTRAIMDDNGSGGVGSQLVSYDHLGGGAIVQADYLEPDLRLDHHRSDSDGDYEGYDRFGRIKDHLWDGYGTTADADQFKYGYDRNSNRVWRKNALTTGYDEFYAYDDLDRLDRLDRGTLAGTAPDYTGVTSPTFAQDWTLDDLGNWTAFKQDNNGDGTGGWDLDQARVHNKANEIDTDDIDTNAAGASITAAAGANWFDPRYDAAGNMIQMPRALNAQTSGVLNTYDAWNRLVAVYDQALQFTLAEYEYDGLGRRVVKTLYDGTEGPGPLETRHFYYSAAWQVIEERVDTSTAADRQFIWGIRYVDDLVLRDRDATTGGDLGTSGSGLDERLYALQDANYNVTALADTSGTVVERFAYQGYGTPKVLDPNWSDDLNNQSDFGWETLFAGYRYDADTGLYHVRNRYYHAQLGRWLTRDPLGYVDGMSLYEYVRSSPVDLLDPFGLITLEEVERRLDAGGSVSAGTTAANDNRETLQGYSDATDFPGAVADELANRSYGDNFAEGWDASKGALGAAALAIADAAIPHPEDAITGAQAIGTAFTACGLSPMQRIGLGLGGAAMIGFGLADLADVVPDPSDALQKGLREGVENALKKTTRESAADLSNKLGRNRVSGSTAGGKQVDIDLQGKGHFDKATGQRIETPHVHEADINVGPNGQTNLSNKTTRPATDQDIRNAKRLSEDK